MSETIINNEKWPITNSRYVGFIDIMGFKDLVSRLSHDEVYEMMKKIDDSIKYAANIPWNDIKESLVKTTTYSDSIMLYSKDATYESMIALINTTATLSYYLFSEAIPHKGSVAFGKMTLDVDNSIFFGQPLIDAYLLQEELYFYGIVVHASAEKEISTTHKGKPSFTHNYFCPLKGGNANHLTVYPIYSKYIKAEEADRISKQSKLFDAIEKFKFKTSGHLRKYIDNTETYWTSLKKA